MTERLRDSPDELDVLVARTAAALGIPAAFDEKDFWVAEVLRAASPTRKIAGSDESATEVLFLFKGGTSLSRVFGIIDRFSEDVDLLAVLPDGMTNNSRHSILTGVDTDVTAHLGVAATDVAVTSSELPSDRQVTTASCRRNQMMWAQCGPITANIASDPNVNWRNRWDLNPRWAQHPHNFSRVAPSAARTRFHRQA
jgi:Nucleotidyl transferase AbiEii toxin, Type IV TA system